jgi:hypothetical protein
MNPAAVMPSSQRPNEEALQDPPDRIARQADGGDQQQRAPEGLPEHGHERAAGARHSSAEPRGDLQRQHPDDYVQKPFTRKPVRASSSSGFMLMMSVWTPTADGYGRPPCPLAPAEEESAATE